MTDKEELRNKELDNNKKTSTNKEKLETERKETDTIQVSLEPFVNKCFINRKIGFSLYPMDGTILKHIMKELLIKNVVVKEISC